MFLISLYCDNNCIYYLSTNQCDESYRGLLVSYFQQYAEMLRSYLADGNHEIRVTFYNIPNGIGFISPDNGNGCILGSLLDPAISDIALSLQKEITDILERWDRAMKDPWIKQHIDHPYDWYWEIEADRWGCE